MSIEADFLMFDNEIAINEQLINYLTKVASDIPDDALFHPSAGHGHPPMWILGHLAIVGETGQKTLGGTVTHAEWIPLFGRGSSDIVHPDDSPTKEILVSAITENYQQLRTLAASADADLVKRPHQVALFAGSPIKTIGHMVTLVLTSHFSFHLSQLSSCRRDAGFGPLF